jgi:hypothetical protein
MRGFLRAVAVTVIILNLITLVGLILLFVLSPDKMSFAIYIVFIGGSLGTILLAGILWVLIEIADVLTAQPDTDKVLDRMRELRGLGLTP